MPIVTQTILIWDARGNIALEELASLILGADIPLPAVAQVIKVHAERKHNALDVEVWIPSGR